MPHTEIAPNDDAPNYNHHIKQRKLSICTEEENDGEKYKKIKSLIKKKCLKLDLILTI